MLHQRRPVLQKLTPVTKLLRKSLTIIDVLARRDKAQDCTVVVRRRSDAYLLWKCLGKSDLCFTRVWDSRVADAGGAPKFVCLFLDLHCQLSSRG